MPTTARLVAAILFAMIGWFTADLVKPLLPEGMAVGRFSPVSAAFGLAVGWVFCGKRLEAGATGGFGIGLTSSVLLTFWVLLTFSGYQMLEISMRSNRYDGPVEALIGMSGIFVENLWMIATPPIIGTLAVGGLLAGWITEKIARRWS